ncbi:hypothetical protein J4207_01095 [Candidatus Woesearchaeota archaeon]|nr:hypothetical protein [Candidatus Woesearchaeota archaeon]
MTKKRCDVCKDITEHMKYPEYVRAAYEFIRYSTGLHRPAKNPMSRISQKKVKFSGNTDPKAKKDICDRIKVWQKDPEFLRAGFEFILYHTGHRRLDTKS